MPEKTVLVKNSGLLEMDQALDVGLVGTMVARGEEKVGGAHFGTHVGCGRRRGERGHEIGNAFSK